METVYMLIDREGFVLGVYRTYERAAQSAISSDKIVSRYIE